MTIACAAIALILSVGWMYQEVRFRVYIEDSMHLSRTDEEYRRYRLSRIPLNANFSREAMAEALRFTTGEPYTDTLLAKSLRLTIVAKGDTFVFESDSLIASYIDESAWWKRVK